MTETNSQWRCFLNITSMIAQMDFFCQKTFKSSYFLIYYINHITNRLINIKEISIYIEHPLMNCLKTSNFSESILFIFATLADKASAMLISDKQIVILKAFILGPAYSHEKNSPGKFLHGAFCCKNCYSATMMQ